MKVVFSTILLLLLITFVPIAGFCQDKIYFSDGRMEDATVIQTDDTFVHYKKYNNPNGPIYKVRRKEIAVIEFSTGEFSILRKPFVGFSYDSAFSKKNFLSFNTLGLIINAINLSYERIIFDGKVGVRVPVFWGFKKPHRSYNSPVFVSGLGCAYYFTGQEKFSLYLANNFLLGTITRENNQDKKNTYRFFGNSTAMGFRVNWNQSFAIALEVGGGFIFRDSKKPAVMLSPALNFSYHF